MNYTEAYFEKQNSNIIHTMQYNGENSDNFTFIHERVHVTNRHNYKQSANAFIWATLVQKFVEVGHNLYFKTFWDMGIPAEDSARPSVHL